MTSSNTESVTPGRPVRLVPTAPGLWMTLLGVAVAALAPLFGFLLGSMLGRPETTAEVDPIYWGLFGGVILGAGGVALAVIGGVRLWRNSRRSEVSAGQHSPGSVPPPESEGAV